jgi:hypothetical protein
MAAVTVTTTKRNEQAMFSSIALCHFPSTAAKQAVWIKNWDDASALIPSKY